MQAAGEEEADVAIQAGEVDDDGIIVIAVVTDAGEEEADVAIQAGEVDDDGIIVIAVVTDGAWSRRSHGTNYNVLSGVVIRHF
ncbi:hypothetical protein PR048_032026 [Dryococelus australis]|uniref:Mutator-like transposase domain-containing protein n=1 Tax=Dryococelus australis TaxID=614101 RepID=A0ABQ9G7X1_9NEOP|nr:hypothetical protein PR048_032026 [Dryococelus australis]